MADLNPTGDGAGNGGDGEILGVGNTAFFSGTDGATGNELFKSDGTTATLVKDINGSGASDPENLTNVGGKLFFDAYDGGKWHLFAMNTTGAIEEIGDPVQGKEFNSPFTLIEH